MKNIIPSDLLKLSMEELEKLHWEITNDAYKKTQPIRDEIARRILEKKEQEDLKKAS